MDWTVISVTNNEDVLKSCLLNSPDLAEASEVILQKGYRSAAVAYNSAIDKAKTDLLVFVHQDVYLPRGWAASLRRALDLLSEKDPNWGIAGIYGVNKSWDDGTGFLYCADYGRLGHSFEDPHEVRSLDEVVLIMRKSSNLRFDERLPGFHMYGIDICLEARQRGMKSYAISAFCVHNTNGYWMMPLQFWRCYLYMRKKWRSQLPVPTPCTEITFWCWPIIHWNIARVASIARGRYRKETRFADPSQVFQELTSSGTWLSSSGESKSH
jgi:hypothetical protein